MSCKHIWWNLPTQIKEKLNITLVSKWFKIPTEINIILRQLEQDKPTCYSQSFEPNYKVNWFTLLLDLEKVCALIECSESNLTAFGISILESSNYCIGTDIPEIGTIAYHNGVNPLPVAGDTVYSNSQGTIFYPNSSIYSGEDCLFGGYAIEDETLIVIENGIVLNHLDLCICR